MKNSVSPEKFKTSGLFDKPNGFSRIMLAFAFIAISTFTFAQSPEVRSALRLIDIEQPSKGISELEKLADKSSSNQYYLGLGYLRTGNKEKALQAFEKGISMNEKDGLNHAGKGHVKLLDKNATEAKLHFDKALSVSKSKDANVLKAVAEGYMADTKFILDAINLLNKAKTINGSDPEVHILLGDAYLKQNNGGESVSSYERAGSADPKNGKAFYKVAKVYQRSKNTDMVMEYLNKAVQADPQYAPAYKELGEAYYLNKQADKAVEAYEKYLPITENAGQARYQYAFFLFMAKRYDKANEIFKEVINSPNASPTALKFYAYSLIEQGKGNEARPVLEQYFQKVKPEEIQASDYAYYGKLLVDLKEDSLANDAFAKSLDLDSAQFDVLQLQATTFMKRKKYVEAAETTKQLMSIRNQPAAQDYWNLGQAYYFSDQFSAADSAFSKVVEMQGEKTPLPVYLFAARAKANVDSTMTTGLAKPMYDTFLSKALQDPEKNKKSIIEAYEYLGAYSIHKEGNVVQAKSYYDKILQLDPAHSGAKEFMRELNKPAPAQKGR
ncbi:tetratricopeptide repeat protein [Chryseosolibacter indicus]|uniref:Tetratricopeptide repeat protein n=1 Tax=Chryseosolibacter indicus TaxID=2782351 RepID=A0ABS5VU36_9BACT|nr:CDC27 family protein [Chryseosolibacter indicus]MBT1704940.1 tetratricopeptide repeat protein [Chryseosolibacter indicus]